MKSTFLTRCLPRRALLASAAFSALAALGTAGTAQAQAWPTQPIKLIVAFAPGGAADTVTRLTAKEMEKTLGQPVVVDNKPGGSTFIATQALTASKPDGYTMMVVSNDTLMVNPHLFKAPYDIRQSFDYVAIFGEYAPAVLVARTTLPVNDAKEAIEYLKKNPGKVNYASHGTGSTSHIRMELLLAKLGVKQNHIPYKGGAPALQDLSGGQVDFLVDSPVSSMPLVKAGRIKAVAAMGKERYFDLPNVMTLGEAGAGAGDFVTFQGIMAPKGTPPAVIKAFSDAVSKAVSDPVLREALGSRGLKPVYRGPAEFQALVYEGSDMMKKVITDNNITAGN